jgi:flavin reductase (DIM6/NTAB) family NADH-FMN oxidoreductase RutF
LPAPPRTEAPAEVGFRQVLGHFCTGVTVITTDGPAGFACQAFAALSLEPPLVLFCPSRSSTTWPVIERAGHFCVNVPLDIPNGPGRGAPPPAPCIFARPPCLTR